ncbi:hypothetical protein TL5118_03290 [Thalassovita autumnalis]|uniref:N-acetyltransferase domain-containing protein n=2 Tax=Thalassovita autumnalis TaxID=2072972 RepID=A0A0P1FMC1_9RHOB|nr:hypothetical protein TL5118_03290 [Thalassovita autumnalis]CUH74254.1 hypothetical protein TL5120_04073 [Thalassovita autumnalis]
MACPVAAPGLMPLCEDMTNPDILIQPLGADLAPAAFDLATSVFVASSTLHQALGITLEAYRTYLQDGFQQMVQEGLSVVAQHQKTGEVLGCLIVTDFHAHLYPTPPQDAAFAPLAALTAALAAKYRTQRSIDPGHVILVDMGAVSPAARGLGLYKSMRQAAHQRAKTRGFTHVVGELSSATTQAYVLGQLGHQTIAEVPFQSFEHNGTHPFAKITDPQCLVLAEGRLTD